jgi:DNA modification methylase
MSMLLQGDCLEEMKQLDDDSIDLIFCDLPYGQTSCAWDCKIDLEAFWKEIMRIKKTNTPLFFTTTTKFGLDLLNSAPKKCPFRYDLVWMKSSAAGFLSAKKMPMRKHEMIYVFYEKLPFYDLSSHQHKFIKERNTEQKNGKIYQGEGNKKIMEGKYDPPLPVSVLKEGGEYNHIYGNIKDMDYQHLKGKMGNPVYDPPLPTSMVEVKSTRGKHSTEKPVALMEWILKYYSKEGDVVLDPTMGSGSTGVACKNMNRNFIGIEMDPEIYEVAVGRVED